MQKDEIIQIHTFLLQLKIYLNDMVDNSVGGEFRSYDKLNVTPYQVYKSKRDHKLAVFMSSKGIASLLSNNNCPRLEKITGRPGKITERILNEIEKELIIS
jgi:hypothetical protein